MRNVPASHMPCYMPRYAIMYARVVVSELISPSGKGEMRLGTCMYMYICRYKIGIHNNTYGLELHRFKYVPYLNMYLSVGWVG